MGSNDVPVTIVGGGPVGLSMALALARLLSAAMDRILP
jgi:thioredoxin reductase